MITVTYLNGDGGGFAEPKELEEGTQAGDFLAEQLENPDSYKIRVNNEAVTRDYELQDGDLIIANPVSKNIDSGA